MFSKHWMKYAAGFVAGSVGLEFLKSDVAKKAYTYVTAGAFLVKDRVLEDAEKIQAAAMDISEDAKVITEKYYQDKDAKFMEGLDGEEVVEVEE